MTDRPVFYGWVVLAASVALIAVGTGTIFSLAVFLRPLEEEFGWTRSLISGVAFVNWVIFGAGSFAWGALSDRIGARRVVGIGAGILGAALVLSSQVGSAAQLYAAFGVLGATGASAFYVPLAATATRWFTARHVESAVDSRLATCDKVCALRVGRSDPESPVNKPLGRLPSRLTGTRLAGAAAPHPETVRMSPTERTRRVRP